MVNLARDAGRSKCPSQQLVQKRTSLPSSPRVLED